MVLASYKCLKFICRYLIPTALRYPLARIIAYGVCWFNPRRRKTIQSNLAPLVGPQEAARMAPRLLGNFLMTAVDFFCERPKHPRHLSVKGWDSIEQSYRQNRRVIVVTAHIGNWETGISYLVDKGYPVAGVYAVYRDDEIVEWITSHRHEHVQWIPTTPGAADICVAALEQGKILCIAADIPFGEHGRRLTIAGHHARLPMGPWAIALRAKATVIPAFVLRQSPGHYIGTVHEPLKPNNDSLRQQMSRMQDAYRKHLEYYLKTYPEQWGNLQPFWEN